MDLFDLILADIKSVCENDKIPILIRTGCLYGTGIENVNVMEHKEVIKLPHLSLNRDSPLGRTAQKKPSESSTIVSIPILGGLQHRYEWKKAV